MKLIRMNTPQGVYEFPLQVVADNRANYYKEVDGNDFDRESEIDYVMSDDFEGIDWLLNNMDFEDIPTDVLVKISDTVSVSENDFWTDSDDFEIVDEI